MQFIVPHIDPARGEAIEVRYRHTEDRLRLVMIHPVIYHRTKLYEISQIELRLHIVSTAVFSEK
jgi:hypothetical protein